MPGSSYNCVVSVFDGQNGFIYSECFFLEFGMLGNCWMEVGHVVSDNRHRGLIFNA